MINHLQLSMKQHNEQLIKNRFLEKIEFIFLVGDIENVCFLKMKFEVSLNKKKKTFREMNTRVDIETDIHSWEMMINRCLMK